MNRNKLSAVPTAEEQPTMPLWPETGQLLGLGRSSTYGAASRGEIPTIRLGGRLVVPTAALRRMLSMDIDISEWERATTVGGAAPHAAEPV